MIETKIPKISPSILAETAQHLSLVIMSAALVWSAAKAPEESRRTVLLTQPVPVLAEAGEHGGGHNSMRHEQREETAPHYISYSEVQRTPTRSGRN